MSRYDNVDRKEMDEMQKGTPRRTGIVKREALVSLQHYTAFPIYLLPLYRLRVFQCLGAYREAESLTSMGSQLSLDFTVLVCVTISSLPQRARAWRLALEVSTELCSPKD